MIFKSVLEVVFKIDFVICILFKIENGKIWISIIDMIIEKNYYGFKAWSKHNKQVRIL